MEKNFSGGGEVVGKSSDLRFSLHFGSTDHILGMGTQPQNLPLHQEHRDGACVTFAEGRGGLATTSDLF